MSTAESQRRETSTTEPRRRSTSNEERRRQVTIPVPPKLETPQGNGEERVLGICWSVNEVNRAYTPISLNIMTTIHSPVTSVESFHFLGTTITKELKWEQNIRSLIKKAQQRMYFLRQLKNFLLPVKMLVNFYTAIIKSILTSSITVWFAAATARDKAKLQ
ncbi:hypothetical protein QTP86_024722, partial [Hemibagrus guttatus]